MKLRTKMQAWRDGKTIPRATDTSKSFFFIMEHDAAAAHALMQALDSWNHPQSEWLKAKADELMREWGYELEDGK